MEPEAPPQVLELETGAVASGGGCVARAPDGRVVFVRHALPGERVRARVTAAATSFLRADAVEVLAPSPDRVAPPCPHAGPGRCGGCDFQHASLAAQRAMKGALIAEHLRRLAGVTREVTVEPVDGDVGGLGWRTRIRLGVDAAGHPGYRRHRSHELESVTERPVAVPAVAATGALRARWPGVSELEVVTAPDGDGALVIVDHPRRTAPRLPQVGCGLVVNGKVRRSPGSVHATVAGRTFRVSAGVFWQVHTGAASALAAAVRAAVLAPEPGDHVVDLYAGAGLFSVLLGQDVGPHGSVLAVERSKRACDDAAFNGRHLASLEVKRASVTPNLVLHGIGAPDLVVLDPAREGAGRATMTALGALASRAPRLRRVAYVACDPASLGRDLRVALDQGWTLADLRAFDIFPMTEHVELVVTLDAPPR